MEAAAGLSVMNNARQGDALALEQLLRRTYPIAVYHCRMLLEDPVLVEQTTRDILFTLGSKLNHLESPSAYTGWVNRTSARLCVNALRRSGAVLACTTQWDSMPEAPDTQLTPDPSLDQGRVAAAVEQTVISLPLAERVCLFLFYFDGLSLREIALLLQVPEHTVGCTLKEARLQLGKLSPMDTQLSAPLSPLPYLNYFLSRRMEALDDPIAARSMVRSILAGPPQEPPAAVDTPEDYVDDALDIFPEIDPIPQLRSAPQPEEQESGFPFWLVFAAILAAVAIGFAASVFSNGASFSQLIQNILGVLF